MSLDNLVGGTLERVETWGVCGSALSGHAYSKQATLLVDGREKRAPNPLEQARECAMAIKARLERDAALVAPPGRCL
ncbi:MAG: hypothetical protein ACT4P4_00460 [Betaproteobacteria bacterium]